MTADRFGNLSSFKTYIWRYERWKIRFYFHLFPSAFLDNIIQIKQTLKNLETDSGLSFDFSWKMFCQFLRRFCCCFINSFYTIIKLLKDKQYVFLRKFVIFRLIIFTNKIIFEIFSYWRWKERTFGLQVISSEYSKFNVTITDFIFIFNSHFSLKMKSSI